MQKIIEVQGFRFSFTLDGVVRDESFSFERFNYGGGSFFQKFKHKVPETFFDALKALKEMDVYIMDGMTDSFNFTINGLDEERATKVAQIVAQLAKFVHGVSQPVTVHISQRILVDAELADKVV